MSTSDARPRPEPEGRGPETPWHTLAPQQAGERLGASLKAGLSSSEAKRRLSQHGPNRLREEEEEGFIEVFLEEIREPMILLLLGTGVLYSIWGHLTDAITIFAVILALVGVEVFNEYRAGRAIRALQKLAEPTTPVRRGGEVTEVPPDEIVPGDVIVLQAGRRIPADALLLEAYGLAADESPLTGESAPADKQAGATLPEDAALAERSNMVFAGTTIVRGRGSALVVATGMGTQLGRVAGLAREVEAPRTPLQKAMRELSATLVWLALGFSVLVPLLGVLLTGQPLRDMILTGLSLAFATIPEELPIIITMVLALGAYRLARRNAIAKRLQAVETLGAVTVIATDKTGTLTENRMQVDRLYPESRSQELLRIGVLCNDADLDESPGTIGDPFDVALLKAAQDSDMNVAEIREAHPQRDEFTFDNERKRMSVVFAQNGGLWIGVKGAPEAVLAVSARQRTDDGTSDLSDEDRQRILDDASDMAEQGLRILALAEKTVEDGSLSQGEAEADLTFVGLAAFADPPRPEAKEAVAACLGAGIRPIMITGDHPLTARAIARQVGLDGDARSVTGPELDAMSDADFRDAVRDVSIYARTTPEHKLRIVKALQDQGQRVAVTGDGINDAPALAAADIGVAMGQRGTDVAREAAGMVLSDDNFATIVRAVEQGRMLFANLKKGVRYYLSVKVALITTTLVPVLLQVPVPFAPIQIILMELFMDLAASATFVAEPPEGDLMHQPPRDPNRRFMDRPMVASIFTSAVGLFAAVTLAYLLTWYGTHDVTRAHTMAFVTWLLGHVFLALNMRSDRVPLLRLGLFSNRLMVVWAVATVVFVLVSTFVPAVHVAFRTTSLTGGEWALAVGAAFVGTFWMEIQKWVARAGGSSSDARG